MGRRLRGVLFGILVGAVALYLIVGPIKPQDVVACDFVNQPGPSAPSTAFSRDPIGAVHVEASTRATTVDGMSQYDGLAKWKTGGKEAQGAVSGVIWQAKNGAVEGLFLTISSPSLSQELKIATLNRDGMLDTNRSNAFLFTDRNDKASHPVSFTCQSDRNYRHIYQRLFSYGTLAGVGLALIILALMFLAGRKADSMEFGQR
jgi:hypothetical protein